MTEFFLIHRAITEHCPVVFANLRFSIQKNKWKWLFMLCLDFKFQVFLRKISFFIFLLFLLGWSYIKNLSCDESLLWYSIQHKKKSHKFCKRPSIQWLLCKLVSIKFLIFFLFPIFLLFLFSIGSFTKTFSNDGSHLGFPINTKIHFVN